MIIYKLTSPSGKIYIGQTQQTLKARLCQHLTDSSNPKENHRKLFRAINKYGFNNFTKEILYDTNDLDILNKKEMEYIQLFNSMKNGYNSTLGGGGMKGLSPSLETREKLRQINLGRSPSEKTREKLRQIGLLSTNRPPSWPKGKKHKPESIEKLRKSKTGVKYSQESKDKMSDKASSTWKIILPNDYEVIIKNLTKFCKENDLNLSCMLAVADGRQQKGHHRGYKCEKVLQYGY